MNLNYLDYSVYNITDHGMPIIDSCKTQNLDCKDNYCNAYIIGDEVSAAKLKCGNFPRLLNAMLLSLLKYGNCCGGEALYIISSSKLQVQLNYK